MPPPAKLGLVTVTLLIAYVFAHVGLSRSSGRPRPARVALGIALAERFGGEIINCDSTAVYRGFDIGTDKVPLAERRGIPHHLIDIADPTEEYTAALCARRRRVIDDIHARGKLPILVGGTGFYYRALTRGLFPGPGRTPALRAASSRSPATPGRRALAHGAARRSGSAARIQPRDRSGWFVRSRCISRPGKPLTAHFADTVSPLAPDVRGARGARMDAAWLADRLAARVDAQFAPGMVDEIRGCWQPACRRRASVRRPGLSAGHGLPRGVRDRAATRELIVRENRGYARRQLIWFREEPNLVWFDGPGTNAEVQDSVIGELAARDLLKD